MLASPRKGRGKKEGDEVKQNSEKKKGVGAGVKMKKKKKTQK